MRDYQWGELRPAQIQWHILHELPVAGRAVTQAELAERLASDHQGHIDPKSYSKKIVDHTLKLSEAILEILLHKEGPERLWLQTNRPDLDN